MMVTGMPVACMADLVILAIRSLSLFRFRNDFGTRESDSRALRQERHQHLRRSSLQRWLWRTIGVLVPELAQFGLLVSVKLAAHSLELLPERYHLGVNLGARLSHVLLNLDA